MGDPDNSIFISYRRKLSPFVARSIFENLISHKYDTFMDVESIDSGSFENIIFHQIAARTHFLVILTPGTLEPTSKSGDWLRREVEHAITLKRNVVPVMAQGFEFSKEAEHFPKGRFPGGVEELRGFNGIDVPHDYFDEAMCKLRERFLRKPKTVAITPAPQTELADVERKIDQAIHFVPSQSTLNRFGLKASPFSKIPWFTLDAPILSFSPLEQTIFGVRTFSWTSVLGANNYVLQSSMLLSFSRSIEKYKGNKTEYSMFFGLSDVYCRVKAENEALKLESPWSNVISLPRNTRRTLPQFASLSLEEPFSLEPLTLPAPKLDKSVAPPNIIATQLQWTFVIGARSYELQRSSTELFLESEVVYSGDKNTYICPPGMGFFATYFRVRAVSLNWLMNSAWSNVVKMSLLD
jgi:hypothetical protein